MGLALLVGCGGDNKAESASTTRAQRSGCPPHVAAARRPAGFPKSFPLPPQTVITSTGRPAPGSLFLRGLVTGGLSETAGFFKRRLPPAGFELGEGDSESGEAESEFSGKGVSGKWKVNAIPGCLRDIALVVAIEEN
jgi:hypothetical protein